MFMKPTQVLNYPVSHLNAILPEKAARTTRIKRINYVAPSPPDEETVYRLNAKAKEYPFCIHYRQKKNDPL
jgi:hypothetical protein